MKELIGRVGKVDPGAGETLKVVAYFDRLLEGQAGLDAFVRGAAALSGCTAGIVEPRTVTIRCSAEGTRLPAPQSDVRAWPSKSLWHGSDSVVWLEREGECSPTDAMILERFVMGARVTLERISGGVFDDHASLSLLLDAAAGLDARRRAATRLKINERQRMRVVASRVSASDIAEYPHSTIMDTPFGPVQAHVETEPASMSRPLPPSGQRVGLGPWGELSTLPRSWQEALVALRMTTEVRPVVSADALGAVALLATIADASSEPHPDVERIARLVRDHSWAISTLDALADRDTVRQAAALLGIHHSTLQSRLVTLESELGFQTTAPAGQLRLSVALALYHLFSTRFEQTQRSVP